MYDFVYFAHSEIYSGYTILPINNVFRPFYVNAFFLVSGYLLFKKQWSESMLSQSVRNWISPMGGRLLISNVMYRLAIPTILFAFINFFPKKIIRGEGIEVKDLLMDTLGGCSLWFTCSLVLVELFIFVILLSRSNKEWIYLIISVLIALIGLFIIDGGVSILGSEDIPWFYKRATIAQFYVICGGVFCKYENQISRIV